MTIMTMMPQQYLLFLCLAVALISSGTRANEQLKRRHLRSYQLPYEQSTARNHGHHKHNDAAQQQEEEQTGGALYDLHQFVRGKSIREGLRDQHHNQGDALPTPDATTPRDEAFYLQKFRQFRKNKQNKQSRKDASGQTMGDPSTLPELAHSLSPNAKIQIKEDTPFMQRLHNHPMQTGQDLEDFLKQEQSLASGFRNINADFPAPSTAAQRVYLDFNNGANYTAVINGVTMQLPAHFYTLEEQVRILERFQMDYEGFNLEFFIDDEVASPDSPDDEGGNTGTGGGPPLEGEFATVRFNEDILPLEIEIDNNGQIISFSILFGFAPQGIDFLNVNYNDTALVNGNFWELLVTVDPTGKLLSETIGVPINNEDELEEVLSSAVTNQSATTGAHELAHNLGTRHHDAVGAIGDGWPLFIPLDEQFVPLYSGQRNATESLLHIMATGNSLGLPLEARVTVDAFFSERSAIKLTLAEGIGEILTEEEAKASIIELPELEIQNTILNGKNQGKDPLVANALVITGNLAEEAEVDAYRLSLEEGTFLTAEIISTTSGYLENRTLTQIAISRDDGGTLVQIFNNSQVFEPFDPLMIDVPITETGAYVVEVRSRRTLYVPTGFLNTYDPEEGIDLPEDSEFLAGDYWLLLYNLDHEAMSGADELGGRDSRPRHPRIPTSQNPFEHLYTSPRDQSHNPMEEFRQNTQNRKSKQDVSGKTMGDPSTLPELAQRLSPNVTMTVENDDPFWERLWKRLPSNATGKDLEDFLRDEQALHAPTTFRNTNSDLAAPSTETQRVYLDFNNGATYTAIINGVTMELPAHFYTLEEQITILNMFRMDYEGFNLEFFIDEEVVSMESPDEEEGAGGGNTSGGPPLEGEFATVLFNQDIRPIAIDIDNNGQITSFSILFGLAPQGIDFLNTNYNDTALVNGNFWELLVTVDPTGKLLSEIIGVPINDEDELEQVLSSAVTNQSATTAIHELGHHMGLRHHDALGAVGDGLPFFIPLDGQFVPVWNGQRNATESLLHNMATGTSLGQPLAARAVTNPFFSERSAIKLTFADGIGEILSEEEAKASVIDLPELEIQNTILEGENEGVDPLIANAVVITGNIEEPTDVDSYRLNLEEGTFLTAEIISTSSTYVANMTFSQLAIFRDDGGTLVQIFNNSQVFEPFDPMMIDVPITETGTYVVTVSSRRFIYIANNTLGIYDVELELAEDSDFIVGDYWLLLYNLDHEAMSAEERGRAKQSQGTSTQTSSPSSSPSLSQQPSMEPSPSPTLVPTAKATRTKRSEPTPAPTTPAPTPKPTRRKRTPSPTTLAPSFDPSSEPSSEPSSLPTVTETLAVDLDSIGDSFTPDDNDEDENGFSFTNDEEEGVTFLAWLPLSNVDGHGRRRHVRRG